MNCQKNRDVMFIICSVLIPLLLGAYIYIYWDTDSYFGNAARRLLMIPESDMNTGLRRIMRNWGCDFLYGYAMFYALYASTKRVSVSIQYAVACSIGIESMQLIKIDYLKCGTFDIVDIMVEIAAICLGATVLSYYNQKMKKGGDNCE